jgi:hypothetical protein
MVSQEEAVAQGFFVAVGVEGKKGVGRGQERNVK